MTEFEPKDVTELSAMVAAAEQRGFERAREMADAACESVRAEAEAAGKVDLMIAAGACRDRVHALTPERP